VCHGHILYAQLRTLRWLVKYWLGGSCIIFLFPSLIRRAIVWVPFIWVVMYGSILPLRLKWELWEHDRIHCRSSEVLLGAVSCTHVWCAWEQYRMFGDSVLRGDAVTRAMMRVVTHHMHESGVYACGVCRFKFLFCMFILWLGWNEFSVGTLTTFPPRTLVTLWENVVCHRIYRLVLTFVSKFVRS